MVRGLMRVYPDPIVKVNVGGHELLMNWSHNLPSILASDRNYEAEIGRLATFLSRKSGFVTMIDVGANIGDTIAQLPEIPNAKILCVEGSKQYFDLLRTNFRSDPAVSCVYALISDGESDLSSRILVDAGGTGHPGVSEGPDASRAPVVTLDALLLQYVDFQRANFLKVDTDGFDFRVLEGAGRLLKDARPALHVELSFEHWERVGGTNIAEALRTLSAIGYATGILYDNHGFLMGIDSFAQQEKIQMLKEYAARRTDFYLNFVAFHHASGWEEEFFAEESKHRFH
jgi:FkbM family methyltransferase